MTQSYHLHVTPLPCSAFHNWQLTEELATRLSYLQVIQQGHDAKQEPCWCRWSHTTSSLVYSYQNYLVCAAAEQFSINLQANNTTVGEGVKGIHLGQSHYFVRRNFIVKSSEGLTESQSYYRRASRWLDKGSQPHHFTGPKDRHLL